MVEYPGETLDDVYAAVAHPVRRGLLDLVKPAPARVTDLAAPFTISLAAISKHIQVLERAGLVRRSIQGREHLLTLEPTPLITAARWIGSYRRFWEERLDVLEARLAKSRRP